MLLTDKVAIVTGASSGIGAAAASLFAAEGARVVLAARRKDLLDQVAEDILTAGGDVTVVAGDVRSQSYAKVVVDHAVETFGGLDVAFNNAGTLGDTSPIPDMSPENWRNVLDVNLTSAFYAAKYQIPAMVRRGGGSLIFTSTFVGHTVGLPGMGAYAASKAGLIGLTQVLATELGSVGIRVNSLLPGGTHTAMAGSDPDRHASIRSLHALKRMAEPEEIARAALFLASDMASFVTGSAMLADGGNSISKV